MKQITSDKAPRADHILSQAVTSNGLIFVSGQVYQTSNGSLIGGTVAEKLDQIIKNITAILDAAGSSLAKVINVTIYVTDMSQMPEINESYPKYFAELPSRAAIGVSALPLGATIELVVIAEE
jgi:2-iminobutanoate/2-iminopropanoate deaminase